MVHFLSKHVGQNRGLKSLQRYNNIIVEPHNNLQEHKNNITARRVYK